MSVRHLELVLRQIPVSPVDTQRIFLVQRTLHSTPDIAELSQLVRDMNAQMDRDILKLDEAQSARYTPNPDL
jgi:hypothetical protein